LYNKKPSNSISIFLILLFLSVNVSFTQTINPDKTDYRYWIYFKDKGKYKQDDKIEIGSEEYNTAKAELSNKALWRRSKVLSEDKLVSYDDIPVYKDYIDEIKSFGLTINAVSKWFNAVSIKGKTKDLDAIKKLDFVKKIEGVHFLEFTKLSSEKKVYNVTVDEINPPAKTKYNYGLSYWQNEQIKVPELHNYGITGFGITVGMNDDGFNWRRHEALRDRRVKGEYDWIFKDDSVQSQLLPNQIPADDYDQDGHGTATFSELGGFKNGKLIGPAFDADFYLCKTEVSTTETPVEEDYWLQSMEWLESKGIEVFSSSLIYKPFDLPNNSYNYKDMDGKTTVIVRAAEHAAYLGVVVCNSMGNEMQTDPPSVVSPADGDSVVSLGAVDSTGKIAYFSSNGPTSNGIMKPDVVAMGVDTWAATTFSNAGMDSAYQYISGTSFSCPLTAGVCALILSVHPELTPMQVKEALKMTAGKKNNPNNVYGWGLVNAYDAALFNGVIMSNKPEISYNDGNTNLSLYVISKSHVDQGSVKIYYTSGGSDKFKEAGMELSDKIDETNSGKYTVSLPLNVMNDNVKFYFTASDSQKNITGPYNAPKRFFFFNNDTKQLEIY